MKFVLDVLVEEKVIETSDIRTQFDRIMLINGQLFTIFNTLNSVSDKWATDTFYELVNITDELFKAYKKLV